jgi:hypothetical protein
MVAIAIAIPLLLASTSTDAGQKYPYVGRWVYLLDGNYVSDTARIGTNNNFDFAIETNNKERVRVDTEGRVGIGTDMPIGRLHIESTVNTPGTVFELPSNPGIPPWGDENYNHKAVMQWQGGEEKFGVWRNYFNAFEQDWAITYNAPWDYTNNMWLGRDSGDPRANISAFMRFNVAEGDSGQNAFAINFAPPDNAGIPPDWNGASWYRFYDGRTFPTPMPARFQVRGAASMQAIVSLSSHSTVNPLRVDLVADGLARFFKVRNRDTDVDYQTIDPESGNVRIGVDEDVAPRAKLQVADGDVYTSTAGNGLVVKSPNGQICKRIGIDNNGQIVAWPLAACP